MEDPVPSSERNELFGLLVHYEGTFRAHLDLLHKYMAFYLTIMVAVLAATLAAIAQSGRTPKIVALASVAVCGLAVLGWRVALIFYRRHIEAWMNVENILGLLDLRISRYRSDGEGAPSLRFQPNLEGTFIVNWERRRARRILSPGQPVDKVMGALSRRSDVMIAVQVTFALLGVTGAALSFYILFIE